MNRARWTWCIYSACACAVLGGLGWASFKALDLERREAQAQAEARIEEAARLALWRMESTIAPIIARESSRPYFHYLSFYPTNRAYARMANEFVPGEVVVPSPLLRTPEPPIVLYYQMQDGRLTSPQAPDDSTLAAKDAFFTSYEFDTARRRLTDLGVQLGVTEEFDLHAKDLKSKLEVQAAGPPPPPETWTKAQQIDSAQTLQNVSEYVQRAKAQESFNRTQVAERLEQQTETAPGELQASMKRATKSRPLEEPAAEATQDFDDTLTVQTRSDELPVVQGPLVAKWLGLPDTPQLIVERQISIGPRSMTQGFLLDWPALRSMLIESAGDLLPGINVIPAGSAQFADPAALGRRLAAIPAELTLPPKLSVVTPDWSPLRTTLVVTWIAAMAGVAAIGVVLHTSLELAERRGRFVSAVTHELRTPLTTFCMYSQMLADGMVQSPEDQRAYFGTLRTESQRLARIVESVLDYARLGRGRKSKAIVPMRVGELLDQCAGSLAARCEEAGMQLVIERGPDADRVITTDAATVERVLFNLVDNACKYAAQASDRRVHFDVRVSARDVALIVRDHGPGIDSGDRARIFRPFVRGHRQSDGSISGLGLGLALARGLAEQLGGELRLTGAQGGTEFTFRLPLGA